MRVFSIIYALVMLGLALALDIMVPMAIKHPMDTAQTLIIVALNIMAIYGACLLLWVSKNRD
jgi:archaellum biogenesis protein FlaJ (TadC family)